MWAKDFVIIFSLLSSLQTKFKEWFQDTSSLSTGSDSTRLCAITAGELDSPNYGTIPPWGVWFGIWGCRYCWSFWMNFRLSFLIPRYKIATRNAIFKYASLCEKLILLLKVTASTLMSRITDEHLQPTMRIIFTQELAPDISSLVVDIKPNCSYYGRSFVKIYLFCSFHRVFRMIFLGIVNYNAVYMCSRCNCHWAKSPFH